MDYTFDIIFVDKEKGKCFKFLYSIATEGGIELRNSKYFLQLDQNFSIDKLDSIEELSKQYPYKSTMYLDYLTSTIIGQRDPKLGDVTKADIYDDKTFKYLGRIYLSELTPSHPYNIDYIDYADFLNIYDNLK